MGAGGAGVPDLSFRGKLSPLLLWALALVLEAVLVLIVLVTVFGEPAHPGRSKSKEP